MLYLYYLMDEHFNPRAHEGRDGATLLTILRYPDFNPRAHEGRDVKCRLKVFFFLISIHAPTRGATSLGHAYLVPFKHFNPRAHEGRDISILYAPVCLKSFQSTRPRGARHNPTMVMYKGKKFQSTRPRGARRVDFRAQPVQILISIHAPTRGATSSKQPSSQNQKFQSTRPRGARQRRD